MMKIQELLETKLGKTIKEASNAEVYYALLHVVQNMAKDKEVPVKKKKIYYISAEFLRNIQVKARWNSGGKALKTGRDCSLPAF